MDLMQRLESGSFWKDVMVEVINQEGFDPWDIDVGGLADGYMDKIKEIELVNFEVPGTVVLVGAVLVKLKSDMVTSDTFMFEEGFNFEPQDGDGGGVDMDVADFEDTLTGHNLPPSLIEPTLHVRRVPKRKITLPELMIFLKKVINQSENRQTERVKRAKTRVELEVREKNLEMIMKRVYSDIRRRAINGKTTFREVVAEWTKESVVDHLIPVLHLANKGQIMVEQPEIFGEIFLKPGEGKEDEGGEPEGGDAEADPADKEDTGVKAVNAVKAKRTKSKANAKKSRPNTKKASRSAKAKSKLKNAKGG